MQSRVLLQFRVVGLAVAAAALSASCAWSDFDDLEARASVVRMERAEGSDGFGRSLAAASNDDFALLIAGGTPGRSSNAVYNIGFAQSPSTDPAQTGYCEGNPAVLFCQSAHSSAYFALTNAHGDVDLCFAYAWGQSDDASAGGVLARCFGDSADITLRVSPSVRTARNTAFDLNEEDQPLLLSSDPGGQYLLASLGAQNRAWYYVADGTPAPGPVSLPTPDSAGESFGMRNAVVRTGNEDERLLVVSAPEEGQVWLYRATEASAVSVGCLGVRADFGRALATGDVNEDGVDDLAISDSDLVTVFSGAVLAALPTAYSEACSLAALPAGAVLASFGCGSRLSLSGCDRSSFGASIAIGDLDDDGDGEVVVGAPRMTTNGQAQAGAVLVYDAEGDDPHELSDVLYLSSAEGGDLLGTSVTTLRQADGGALVAAGGPGKSKVAVFFCSNLVEPEDRVGRCAP